MSQEIPIDQLIGCNVRGRLEYIQELIEGGDIAGTLYELKELLDFFPEDKQ